MRPPCASTICFEIDRPRPEFCPNPGPGGRCRSGRRSCRLRPGAMPGPSSSTMISMSSLVRRQVTRTMLPGGENERALSTRLSITWASRESLPSTVKADGPPPSNNSFHRHAVVMPHSLATPTTVVQQAREVDRLASWRCISASSRLASEMSVISRSSRLTSCWMTASRRARLSSVLASGRVSTAERSEVSGFFSSCATSAAKLSMLRCGCRARWSCRAACPTDARSRRGGR